MSFACVCSRAEAIFSGKSPLTKSEFRNEQFCIDLFIERHIDTSEDIRCNTDI